MLLLVPLLKLRPSPLPHLTPIVALSARHAL